MQGLLARNGTRNGMKNHAGFYVNFPFGLRSVNLKDAGTPAKALDLDDVRQADLSQRPGKPLALIPRHQITQYIENKAHPIRSDRFFQEKFRSGRKALRTVGFVRDAG